MQQESLKTSRVLPRWRWDEEENGLDREPTEGLLSVCFFLITMGIPAPWNLPLSFLLHFRPEQWDTFPAAIITYSWEERSRGEGIHSSKTPAIRRATSPEQCSKCVRKMTNSLGYNWGRHPSFPRRLLAVGFLPPTRPCLPTWPIYSRGILHGPEARCRHWDPSESKGKFLCGNLAVQQTQARLFHTEQRWSFKCQFFLSKVLKRGGVVSCPGSWIPSASPD